MANVKNENDDKIRKQQKIRRVIGIIIFIIMVVFYLYESYNSSEETQEFETTVEVTDETAQYNADVDGELILTMIDVGQADSFLLIQNGKTALIDCGTRSTGKDAVEYLKSLGITRLDYVFGTHPHDDHMGGMYDVITNFEVGKILIPCVNENITTNWYMKLMKEITSGKYDVVYPKAGDIYTFGDATMKVIGPLSPAGDNKNNYSTVLKVSFGEMDIIMTGDAEEKVEKEILATGETVDAEILKIGHHGSDTSNSEEWLDAISPKYGLISCKTGNKYKHPVKIIMQRLEDRNVEVYRTDECGTVTATITKDSVTFDKMPGNYLSGPEVEMMEGK